jgi:class I fructose-bisphosphate aldolase
MTIEELLQRDELKDLVNFQAKIIPKSLLFAATSADDLITLFYNSDRDPRCMVNLSYLLKSGLLGDTGYLLVFPVDQGVEHSALYSFWDNPKMFDPEEIIRFAADVGFSAVASSFGVLSLVARKFAHKIPMIVKLNHNELLSVPLRWNQTSFATVKEAWRLGAIGVGFTVYFGSPDCREEIEKVKDFIAEARELGLLTFCWCYVRNKEFQKNAVNLEVSDDISSQAVYLGASLGADFVKQKLPQGSQGFIFLNAEGFDVKVSDGMKRLKLTHPIEQTRLQVLHAYAGKIGLLSSGGESSGDDLVSAVKIAIINKRAGGRGLMLGRKVFKKSFAEGAKIVQAVCEVYKNKSISLA